MKCVTKPGHHVLLCQLGFVLSKIIGLKFDIMYFSHYCHFQYCLRIRCNILILHHFPVHISGTKNRIANCVQPLGFVYRNGASVRICTCAVVKYGGSENVTLEVTLKDMGN